jgi:hypothetical protein
MAAGTILTATRPKWAAKSSDNVEFLYRCGSEGPRNNGLKPFCDFEMVFEEGPYHCPLCAAPLARVAAGPSISEILQRGQREADRKKEEGTKK